MMKPNNYNIEIDTYFGKITIPDMLTRHSMEAVITALGENSI